MQAHFLYLSVEVSTEPWNLKRKERKSTMGLTVTNTNTLTLLNIVNQTSARQSNALTQLSAGYKINNEMHSFALELNSRSRTFANRFFASYNRSRDFREPFSEPFPTVEIGEGNATYTTLGHEPFSIHNILDSDVLQFTNNFTYFAGRHVFTVGANFESFSFFNSFNIFRHGVFFLPAEFVPGVGSTFSSRSVISCSTSSRSAASGASRRYPLKLWIASRYHFRFR